MNIGIAVCGLTPIVLLALILCVNSKHEKKANIYSQLIVKSGLQNDFERFCRQEHLYNDNRALIKYFKDKNRVNNIYKQIEIRERIDKETDDIIKKERVINRVFAYKYEKFIYSLFSPLAEQKNGYGNKKGEWICSDKLSKVYVLKKIEVMYHFSNNAAINLFNQFVDNGLLEYSRKYDDVKLGYILTTFWNIVSDADLNIDKYIKQYGQRCNLDELQREIKGLM